jgi:hypothetical protein
MLLLYFSFSVDDPMLFNEKITVSRFDQRFDAVIIEAFTSGKRLGGQPPV